MKSEKAREHIARNVFRVDNDAFLPPIITRDNCNKAVELAEQDAEERMREKAIEALCAANCPQGCSFGADGNIGCGAKARFIQKLNEE